MDIRGRFSTKTNLTSENYILTVTTISSFNWVKKKEINTKNCKEITKQRVQYYHLFYMIKLIKCMLKNMTSS